ncbi:MAG: ammonium transporter [Rhodobacteraceae bacterium]|nr:ammonium transporter [Paracoccaceae bacterium]
MLDVTWVIVAASLVLLMQVGFLLVEAGLVRSKNSINVAQKNLLDLTLSVLVFAAFGFMLAFGIAGSWPLGADSKFFMLQDLTPWQLAFFTFQAMFCGTAATIISGAVAERMRLTGYIWVTLLTAGILYPVFAHLAWGNALFDNNSAFLATGGFVDFAGSTVVHATGGWIALAAVMIMGPRIGRFDPLGRPIRIQGHSPVLSTAGTLILFVGWIGFNGGSTLAANSDVAPIIVNTILAASTGAIMGYYIGKRQDHGIVLPAKSLSGMLGGLAAVTAGCQVLTPTGGALVGLLGGAAAVFGNSFLERKMKIDDPAGAIGVHAIAGVCGTLALAILAPVENLPLGEHFAQFFVQLQGVGINFVWCFGGGYILLTLLNRFSPLRVSAQDEEVGINQAEHGSRLGVGHVEDALERVISNKADLNLRLNVSQGDDSERITRLFNALMDTIQNEETAQVKQANAKRTREEAERLSALANATFDAIVISVDGKILDGNQTLETLLGYSIEDLKMRGLYEFVNSEASETLETHLIKAERAPREFELINCDGETIPVEIRTRVISYRGTPTRVSALVDLRERKKAEERILHLAQHDNLTDLPNRSVFTSELSSALQTCKRGKRMAALLLIDLDHFKDINDLHGHPTGDKVLKVTAERLSKISRKSDSPFRLAGDEFALIQRGVQFNAQAQDVARRLIEVLCEPIDCGDGLLVRPSVSVGISMITGNQSEAAEQIVYQADIALFNAKNAGRRTFCFYKDGMGEAVRQRRETEAALHTAIAEEQFELFFQPRMNMSTGKINNYEALIRWQHPEKGTISPVEFIPVAESSGLIVPIGKWVLETALRCAAADIPDAKISVNVSPIQLRDSNFVDYVEQALSDSGVPAERLELEITESLLIEDDARALNILNRLKSLGIRLALDDFGVGYSSLGYLSRFPFDTIKIDKSFIQDTSEVSSALAIIESVVHLGRALKMSIVVEGVETADKIPLLQTIGCDEVQGYLIGKPASIDNLLTEAPAEIIALLKQDEPSLQEEELTLSA